MRQTESNLSPLYAGRAKYAVLLSLLCAPLAAQTGEAATSELKIKTETRLVLVDAVVTAKKDELVGDLTAKNFHVFADGKEQPITAFQAHAGNATGEIGRQQRILLLFDGRSTEDPVWIEQAVEKFAADNAGPNRPIAVAYYDGGCMTFAAQFTTDVGQLRHALSDWSQTRHCPPIADPQGSHRAEQYSGLAKNLAKLPGHKVVVLFSGRAMQQQSAGGDIGAELSTTRAGGGKDVDVGNGRPDIPGALGSAGMGGGAPAPSSRAPDSSSRALVEPTGMQLEFRKADVSVYTVEGQAGARAPSWAVTLAEKTGGHDLSHGNDIGNALGSIVREHDQGYTLGFVPVDSPEGSCHPLKITVNQPKVKVRGRDLYCNVPETNLAAGRPVDAALEGLANAASGGSEKAALALPFFYETGGAARVNLVLEIPAPALALTEASGKLYATMDVLGLAYNPDGAVTARFGDSVRYDFDSRQQFDEFLRQPLHYEYQMNLAPGKYKYKLVFRLAKDHTGAVEVPLAIEPFDAARLAMSSIAISHDMQPITPEAAQAETDAGRKPLVYHGKRITPAASDALAAKGIGQAYFEVYEPPAKGAEPVKLSMCLRVFDVPGGQKKVDSGDIDLSALAKPGAAIPVGLRLPLSALAVGAYRAEITVKDSAGGEAARSVQFRVE
jgi:VWFA-related protein